MQITPSMRNLPVLLLLLASGLFVSGVLVARADEDGDSKESAKEKGPVRVAPRPQPRSEVDHVGERVPKTSAKDLDGKVVDLQKLAAKQPVVVVVRDVNCPLCKRYGPRLGDLSQEYSGQKQASKKKSSKKKTGSKKRKQSQQVTFVFVNVNEADTVEMMRGEQKDFGLEGRYVHDPEHKLAAVLGVRSTTEAFLIDAAGTLRYRGAVDDQYGIGYAKDAPTRNYLSDAIDAVLSGHEVPTVATTAPGCVIELETESWSTSKTTYHNRISRIVQANCQSCHSKGGVGPFPLETYSQVKARKGMIKYVLENELMPPWFAAEGSGPWENDRRLPDRDREAFLAWIKAGCPKGSKKDAPEEIERTPGWTIGKPDLVVELPNEQKVPAEGVVDYVYEYVQTPNKEDLWIEKMEIRASAPQVVHHVLVFLEKPRQPGEDRREFQRRFAGGLRGYFAGMVPGQGWTIYPEHLGKKLPARAWLKFQIHYTPNGKAARDRTAIAFKFRDSAPKHEVKTSAATNTRFRIPPGDPAHEVRALYQFRKAATIYSFAPHMHLRGKAYKYELQHPDGERELLLDIPRYDFNWQLRYKLAEPLSVPAGSALLATALFDNSSENPANPDPTQSVRFGEQTFDEMMIGYFEWYTSE